jgi:hypothetical protein
MRSGRPMPTRADDPRPRRGPHDTRVARELRWTKQTVGE